MDQVQGFRQFGPEVSLWLEQGSIIMLKASGPQGMPAELDEHVARDLAAALLELARQIEEE
jgi:hypothetical protein